MEYEPFGLEWEKEMMKLSKAELVNFLRSSLKNKWISVKDKMPEPRVPVLITDGSVMVVARFLPPGGHSIMGNWTPEGFGGWEWEWDFSFEQITHWQPLPEPPENMPSTSQAQG